VAASPASFTSQRRAGIGVAVPAVVVDVQALS
jgi:hypothetical protein